VAAKKGAIVLVSIYYRCDFDHDANQCQPQFKFERIDQSSFSSGYNFRYSVVDTTSEGIETRTLYKVMGVRIIFHVSGDAGRFNLVNLMIALGAGAALLGASSLICDFIMQYILQSKEKYIKRKYLPVNEKGDPMLEADDYRSDEGYGQPAGQIQSTDTEEGQEGLREKEGKPTEHTPLLQDEKKKR